MKCCSCNKASKKTPGKEIRRLWTNWLYLVFLGGVNIISILSPLPTLHQFVTNPTSAALNSSLSSIQLGFGQSESFYSLAVAAIIIGSFPSSVITGFLLKLIPYWHLNFTSLVFHVIGWVLYATAVNGWMLQLGRLLAGIFTGMHYTLAYTYFGESFEDYVAAQKELDNYGERQAAVKDIVFAMHGIAMNLANIIGLGVPMLITLIDVDQFRSIAWFNLALGLSFIVLQLLLFRGESDCNKCNVKNTSRCRERKKLQFDIKWKPVLIVTFLALGRATLTAKFMVVETLFNPILSDSFGVNAKWGSYFFFGLIVPAIVGSFAALILRLLNVKNRVIAIIGLSISIIGAFIMADWQSIPYDPCTELSLFHHPELAGNYCVAGTNNIQLNTIGVRLEDEASVHIQQLKVFEDCVYNTARNKCSEAGVSKHHCRWLPFSSVTKELCIDCQPICRSVDRSLYFEQFLIGAILFDFSQPVARITFTAIISDQVQREYQGIAIGFTNFLSGFFLLITPLWIDAAYEAVEKRTFLPMAIMVALMLPFLVGLIVLYPQIGRKENHLDSESEDKKEPILEAANDEGATELTQLMTEKMEN